MKKTIVSAAMAGLLLILGSCGGPHRLKPPRVASEIKLDYPLSAQMKKIEGEVGIAVFVNPKGEAEEVNLVLSSGYAELDEAAVQFSRGVKFEPGTLDDRPVGAWTRLLLRYNLTEVVFQKERWLTDVRDLQEQLAKADSSKRDNLLRRLYTQYIGLLNYAEEISELEINTYVRMVISKESVRRWQPFWDQYAAAFILLDDFLFRYPQSSLDGQANEDLIRKLLDMEFQIRIRAIRSNRAARSSGVLIELIEARLKTLQGSIQLRQEEE
jgi:TonB family protein